MTIKCCHAELYLVILSVYSQLDFLLEPKEKLDIIFLFGSHSTRKITENLRIQRDLASKMVALYNVDSDGVNVGLIEFDGSPRTILKVADGNSPNKVLAHLSRINPTGIGYNVDEALQLALAMLSKSAPRNVSKSVVLFSTGKSDKNPSETADIMRKDKIKIVVVGIGDETDTVEMKAITRRDGTLLTADGDIRKIIDAARQGLKIYFLLMRSINAVFERGRLKERVFLP